MGILGTLAFLTFATVVAFLFYNIGYKNGKKENKNDR